jgi:hypothetical protein
MVCVYPRMDLFSSRWHGMAFIRQLSGFELISNCIINTKTHQTQPNRSSPGKHDSKRSINLILNTILHPELSHLGY